MVATTPRLAEAEHQLAWYQTTAEEACPELDDTSLCRLAEAVPERGRIGNFNRSHYLELIALRVHPEWLARQNLPDGDRGDEFWSDAGNGSSKLVDVVESLDLQWPWVSEEARRRNAEARAPLEAESG